MVLNRIHKKQKPGNKSKHTQTKSAAPEALGIQGAIQERQDSDNLYEMQQPITVPGDATLTPKEILQLQRTIGNQKTQQLLGRGQKTNSEIKPIQYANVPQIQRDKDPVVKARETSAKAQILTILRTQAAANGIKSKVIATKGNATKLLHPLRIDTLKGASDEEWTAHSANVFAVMNDGADHVIKSALHWREQIYPPDVTRAKITKIEIEGSDLHERGLGTLFVSYSKPKDGNGLFPNQKSVKVVIKPEDRSIENALFGDSDDSLANQVNDLAGLEGDEQITTIKMRTHDEYGSLIEFIKGKAAEKFKGGEKYSAGLTEAMAFVMLTGMSDVHKENVIWKNGQPYFIDADNAMSQRIIDNSINQSGFSMYNTDQTEAVSDDLNNAADRGASNSKIMQAFLADAEPFIDAIEQAFSGKTGRIVPIATQNWANALKSYIPSEEGNPDETFKDLTDAYDDILATTTRAERKERGITYPQPTRYILVKQQAPQVLSGMDEAEAGLVGEVGEHPDGGLFDVDAEAIEIKTDFDQGKIPFYTYDYDTGAVRHNGTIIYVGLPLDEILANLLRKYKQVDDPVDVEEIVAI
jgi:hypothetical protein